MSLYSPGIGHNGGPAFGGGFRTFDSAPRGAAMRDARMLDSAGAFLTGELERLDQTIHEPLYITTWGRDIDLREDVVFGDEFSSFLNLRYAGPGGIAPTGKSWVSKTATEIPGVQVDLAKTVNQLHGWAEEVSYSFFELQASQTAGRPVDAQKYDAMKVKYDMDVDEMVYVGDAPLGVYGLLNNASALALSVPAGVSGQTQWAKKTAQEIISDVAALLSTAWANSGYKYTPTKLLLPPNQFAYITSAANGTIGNLSIMEYLKQNSISLQNNGKPLDIQAVKWLPGRGVGGLDRMAVYTQDKTKIRFPLVPLQPMPGGIQYRALHFLQYYVAKLGVVEVTQTEMLTYGDGI